MCKAPNCYEHHQKHYCRVCGNQDSDHRSTSCPEGTILYHATHLEQSCNILKSGFKNTTNGKMGSGVYFSLDFEQAQKLAMHKFGSEKPVVIECIAVVNSKKCSREDSQEEMFRKFKEWFESSKGKKTYQEWLENKNSKKVIVKDPWRIRVKKVTVL